MNPTQYAELCGRLDSLRGIMLASQRGELTGQRLRVPALDAALEGAAAALGLDADWDLPELDEALDEIKAEAMHRLCSAGDQ
jgi:hypothetical protein